ncbi:hypothetical protein HN385_01920 [archaeon]|jgi:hypothetical protein|nr:hypothetical protein [archaeon]MBT3451293.1 hypothetical protein [archaeon]MBT6869446.1 hypothetical protein [archaeon]MBT7192609.1 hypothetical protein [archaeon]MBT7380685.1 hypothetical protein [archaeon]
MKVIKKSKRKSNHKKEQTISKSKDNKSVHSKTNNFTPKLILVFTIILIISNVIGVYEMAKLTGMASQENEGGNVSMCILGEPVISSISNQQASIGRLFNYSVNCSQHCNEELEFYYLTIPTLSSFFINTSTGQIIFTPVEGQGGTYDIYVYCDKAAFDPDSESFELTISSEYLGPEFLTGTLNEDNESTDLNWSFVNDADYYNIYYSENISEIMTLNLDSIPPTVTKIINVSATNWTDYNASEVQKKYYTVSSVEGNNEGLCQDIPVGKFTYYYTAPVSGTYGTLASNRISIYLNKSYTAEEFLQEIPGSLNPTITRMDKSFNNGEYFTTHVRGLSDGNNYNLDISRGYQITVDNYFNQSIVGKVYSPEYRLNYTAPNSTYGTLASNWKGIFDVNKIYTAESFLQEIPGNLNPTISRLDKSDGSGEYLTTHVRGLSDGNDFNMNLGIAYSITVDSAYNHTQCINNSACFE